MVLQKVWPGRLRYLLVATALTASCGWNGCGSSSGAAGNGAPSSTPPNAEAPRENQGQHDSSTNNGDEDASLPASFHTEALPTYFEGPTLLVEIDKFGARVSGGSWFKAQPAEVQRKYKQEFKTQVVSAFRRLSPLKATGRTVGRSLYYPAITGLAALLDKRAEATGENTPVAIDLRVKSGVPFWLVAHFTNFLLWNDGVTHLQVRGHKNVPPLLIARSGLSVDEEPQCAQGHVLIRKGRGLTFWETGIRDGLVSAQDVHSRPEWAGPPETCGPWAKVDPSLFSEPPPDSVGRLPLCRAWRVEAIDSETDWADVATALARSLPAGHAVVLGNASIPAKCDD